MSLLDWVTGWKTLNDSDPLQVGDTVRITFQFNEIPGFAPSQSDVSSAFAEFADVQVQSVDEGPLGGWLGLPGFSQWKVTGISLDNCTAGATKGQVWNVMNSLAANTFGGLTGLQVTGMEIALGSPSSPNQGLLASVTDSTGASNPSSTGMSLMTTAGLFAIALIVLGVAYMTGFFTTRKAV